MTTYIHVDGLHSKTVEEKISAAARRCNGRLDFVTDKGVAFVFGDDDGAFTFQSDCRELGVYTSEVQA